MISSFLIRLAASLELLLSDSAGRVLQIRKDATRLAVVIQRLRPWKLLKSSVGSTPPE